MNEVNKMWKKYQEASSSLDKMDLRRETYEEWDFYLGNQWKGLKNPNNYPLPFHNIIKPIVKYKVGTVCQINSTARYSDMDSREDLKEVYDILNANFDYSWENYGMDDKLREVVLASAVAGDAYLYWGTKNSFEPEVIPNFQVLLGDEQEKNLQEQPFIIIRERVSVQDIKALADKNGVSAELIANIKGDSETEYLYGDNIEEVDIDGGKCTVIRYMTKIKGVVHFGRATEYCVIEELSPIQVTDKNGVSVMTATNYPMISLVWEDKPNSARGQGEVRGLIANQISINQQLVRRDVSIKQCAFPKLAYDANAIQNPEEIAKVGAPISIMGGNSQSINQMISYLQPAGLSPDAKMFNDDMIDFTRNLAGATETNLGQIDPTRVAASALATLKDQSILPLQDQMLKVNRFIEDFARISIELLALYNPNGISLVISDENGAAKITDKELMAIKPRVKVDISQNTPWSRAAEEAKIEKLLETGQITFEESVELSDNGPLPKSKLEGLIAKREEKAKEMANNMIVQDNQMLGGVPNEM